MHKPADDAAVEQPSADGAEDFETLGSEQGLIAEFWEFLLENKKFWMIPIVLVMVVLGLLIAAGGTAAAPFIYSLF
jgi:hypothetical protein